MKSILTLLLATASISFSFAQSAFDKMVDEVCTCMDSKPEAYQDQSSLQMAMMECGQRAIMSNPMEIMQERGITDPNDMKAMTKLGQDMGIALIDKCPSYSAGVQKMSMDMATGGGTPKAMTQSITGRLANISGDHVAVLSIVGTNGIAEEVYWLESFDGDSDLLGNSDKYIGQNVKIDTETIKLYDPKLSAYREVKTLRGIALSQK